jgi:hypothetical protein
MPIRFDCDSCGKHYRVKYEAKGRRFECLECGEPLRVPIPQTDTDEPAFDPYADTQIESPGSRRPTRVRAKTKSRKRRQAKPSLSSGRQAWLWGGAAAGLVLVGVIAVVVWRSSRPQKSPKSIDNAKAVARDEADVVASNETEAATNNETESPPRDVTAGKPQDTVEDSPAPFPLAYPATVSADPLPVCIEFIPTVGNSPGKFTRQATTLRGMSVLVVINADGKRVVTTVSRVHLLFAFSPDGKRVLTNTQNYGERQSLLIRDAATGTAIGQPLRVGANNHVYAVSFSPNGETVLTGGLISGAKTGKAAQLFSAKTGEPLGGPLLHDGTVWAVAFSPDGQTLLTGSGNQLDTDLASGRFKGQAQLWDTRTRTRIGPPLRHYGMVNSATFSPDGKTILTASSLDVVARLWDVETGKSVGEAMRHDTGVMAARFGPDGRVVATASWDKTARLWDAATGSAIGKPLEHEDAVIIAVFSPDSKRLVTGSIDNEFQLWDVAAQTPIGAPMQHEGRPTVAAFSPDGKLLATASQDRAVQLWNGETGERLEFPFEKSPEFGGSFVTFSPDGKSLLTGIAAPNPEGFNLIWWGFIRVWNLAKLPGNDSIRGKQ